MSSFIEGRIRQRKERDGLRLSSAVPKIQSGLEIFFQTNLSCRASAPKNSLVLTKNLLALLLRSENEKNLK